MASTGLEIEREVPLAPLTTFKIGGPASFFATARSETQLTAAVRYAADAGLNIFVLGGGSNILVADKGFDGLTVKIDIKGITVAGESEDRVEVDAAAGEDWDGFVEYCVTRSYAGVECLSGIPGFVGGTPIQNVGAYGQEVSESIVSVTAFDRRSNGIVTLSNGECGFGYRSSIFNSQERDRYIVTTVRFALRKGGEPKLNYRELRERFAGSEPELVAVRSEVINIRRAKSMVIDPADPNSRTAGSFFKNPLVTKAQFDALAGRFETIPSFPADGGMVKIPAAWLIENAGFPKGYVRGNAGISSSHTLALISRAGGTAADIIGLKEEVQAAVFAKFGIELMPEPIFVGF